MTKMAFAGALMLAAAVLVAPAHGQDLTKEQNDEAHCVVLHVPPGDETETVIATHVDPNAAEYLRDASGKTLKAALDACLASHDWSDSETNFAVTLGLAYLTMEWMSEAALDDEVPADLVNNLQPVLDGLTEEEQDEVFLSRWESDETLKRKVRSLLVAQGWPDADGVIYMGSHLLTNVMVYATQLARFVAARFP